MSEAKAVLVRSGFLRAKSRAVRARSLALAVDSAVTQDLVAGTLGQLATRHPRYSANLRELSQTAASHATRLRQWAKDHAATG